jgi:hypothetical protein
MDLERVGSALPADLRRVWKNWLALVPRLSGLRSAHPKTVL